MLTQPTPAAASRAPPRRPSLWLVPALVLTAVPVVIVIAVVTGGRLPLLADWAPFLGIAPLIGSWCAWRARITSAPLTHQRALARSAQFIGTAWSILIVISFVVSAAIGGGLWQMTSVHSGRPWRRGRHIIRPRLTRAAHIGRVRAAPPDVVRAWRYAAREEAGAVRAFQRLAVELECLGAPAALVERARQAAADEVVHTRLLVSAAASVDGDEWIDVDVMPATRKPRSKTFALCRIACESIVDGAFNERVAGEVAAIGAAAAHDQGVAEMFATIARDEHQHAEYGWDVLRFCLDAGGEPVARAATLALSLLANRTPPKTPFSSPEWGLVDAEELQQAWLASRSVTIQRGRALCWKYLPMSHHR